MTRGDLDEGQNISDQVLAAADAMSFIVTRDRARAIPFYRDVLGFPLISEDPFAVVFDMNGTMLRVSQVSDHVPAAHTVLGWGIADIVATVTSLVGRGVQFNRYAGMAQDDLGIWTPPGSRTRVAWFLDPDGNNLSLTQF